MAIGYFTILMENRTFVFLGHVKLMGTVWSRAMSGNIKAVYFVYMFNPINYSIFREIHRIVSNSVTFPYFDVFVWTMPFFFRLNKTIFAVDTNLIENVNVIFNIFVYIISCEFQVNLPRVWLLIHYSQFYYGILHTRTTLLFHWA